MKISLRVKKTWRKERWCWQGKIKILSRWLSTKKQAKLFQINLLQQLGLSWNNHLLLEEGFRSWIINNHRWISNSHRWIINIISKLCRIISLEIINNSNNTLSQLPINQQIKDCILKILQEYQGQIWRIFNLPQINKQLNNSLSTNLNINSNNNSNYKCLINLNWRPNIPSNLNINNKI